LVLMLIVGLVLAFRAHGRNRAARPARGPDGTARGRDPVLARHRVGAFGSAWPLAHAIGTGPERARQSRYVYLTAAMALPALALAADAIVGRRRFLAIPIVALLLVGVPGNVHQLRIYTNQSLLDRRRFERMSWPRRGCRLRINSPPRSNRAGPSRASTASPSAGSSTVSLLDGSPPPRRLTRTEIADETLRLALRPAAFRGQHRAGSCARRKNACSASASESR